MPKKYRSLKYQFLYLIDKNFKKGMDKHAIKRAGEMNGIRVFSYSERKNLIDLSANLGNFMQETYPEIKKVIDISPAHIQEFLNIKATSCSDITLQQYRTRLLKLERIIKKEWNIDWKLKNSIYVPASQSVQGKRRCKSIADADYNRLLELIKDSPSPAVRAIWLARNFGLRVSETTKLQKRDIDIEEGILHIIDSKGKRSRDIEIPEEHIRACEELKETCIAEKERLIPLQSDSVNRYLGRKLKELGIDEYNGAATGIHALRKAFAQEYFDKCRAEHLEVNKALSKTSRVLGHGDNRKVLMSAYVLNIY